MQPESTFARPFFGVRTLRQNATATLLDRDQLDERGCALDSGFLARSPAVLRRNAYKTTVFEPMRTPSTKPPTGGRGISR